MKLNCVKNLSQKCLRACTQHYVTVTNGHVVNDIYYYNNTVLSDREVSILCDEIS